MAAIFSGYATTREAVRVKVKKIEASQPPELRKFSVDPQITSFEVLQSILGKAFDLKCDFTISYRLYDVSGHESYLPLVSDYDLDAAFIKAHNMSVATNSEPCLCLRVDLKPFEECCDDWEVKSMPSRQMRNVVTGTPAEVAKPSPRLHGIFNQVGKTLNMMQKAFNFGDETNNIQPPRPPLSDTEFRRFLDPVGQIIGAKELRSVIYFGGIDPSLRKVVWKHLLNVYPDGMTGRERMDYIKKKAAEYVSLKETWKNAIAQGPVVGELAYTTGMVRKDVLRTDRHHPFYAGSDDNQNIAALFNILTTYALNHPKVSYCQGMSDLASPLLVTMNDEAHAYICFCALMQRLNTNFMIDGIAMTQKFTHLAEGLMFYDSEFYNYLKIHQADDLLFCYRWLLLEMKREFAFEDSLRMLEVLWSSLPADPPEKELKLYDVKFQPVCTPPPISPLVKTPRENAYTKICALRRQSSSISLSNYSCKKTNVKRQNHSLDENVGRNFENLKIKQHQSLDDAALNKNLHLNQQVTDRPRSVSPNDSDSSTNKKNANLNNKIISASMNNLIKNRGGHFRDLKEKIAASLEKLDTTPIKKELRKGKMVKNFNEFLNFGGKNEKPTILLTKSSMDDSESSSSCRKNTSNSSCEENNDTFDECSPDDDSQEYFPLTTSVTRELRLELENLDRKVFGDKYSSPKTDDVEKLVENEKLLNSSSSDICQDLENNSQAEKIVNSQVPELPNKTVNKKPDDCFIWENPLHQTSPTIVNLKIQTPDEQADIDFDPNEKNSTHNPEPVTLCAEEVTEAIKSCNILPPPNEFGGGNPFLMFLCITVLLQHREQIISKAMDYNEMAMHFDKMVRKHNVIRVLNQARQMYARYIKQHSILAQKRMEAKFEEC